ncbi:MAG: glycosyltransferase family 39 protein [Bryobacteraceae bacterium]
MRFPTEIRERIEAAAAIGFFLLSGMAFIGSLGIEVDEALPAGPLYQPKSWYYAWHFGHARIPLMHMSYLGTLKTWIWRPIFQWWGTGVWPLRFPALLAGAVSIWLFYCFLRATVGARAAVIGCAILAADSQYLLTTTFDWGPVALQHLLIGAGLVLLVKFHRSANSLWLAAGCFLLGLAVWDKMLALWMLSGLAIGALAAVPRQILAAWSWRRLAIAALTFLAGALPVVLSGIHDHFAALRENAGRTVDAVPGKITILQRSLNGEGLFGFMFAEDGQTPAPRAAANLAERLSAATSERFGHPRRSLQLYACLLALVLAPLARGRDLRAILFALVAMAVAWIQMATTPSAGGSVHHTILLWPLPAMVMAVSFAAASRRLGRAGIPAVAVILALLVGSDVLVTNEYFWKSVRNGGSHTWSDALFPLSADLMARRPAAVYCADWDIFESLRLLDRGALPLRNGMDPAPAPDMTQTDRQWLLGMIATPDAVWVTHVPAFEFFPAVRPKLDRFAAAAGFEHRLLEVICDMRGRPTFELYRFQKQAVP